MFVLHNRLWFLAGVFVVICPMGRVGCDVKMNAIVFIGIADDMFIIIALPDVCAVELAANLTGDGSFIGAHDCGNGTRNGFAKLFYRRCALCNRRGMGAIPGTCGSGQVYRAPTIMDHNNAVDVIGHDNIFA